MAVQTSSVKRVLDKCSLLSVFFGASLVLTITAVIFILTGLVHVTPALYYPGENDCDMISAEFQGNDSILWCPDTRVVSNLSLIDINFQTTAYRYNSTPSFYPDYIIHTFNIDWYYDLQVGNETNYWSFQLNRGSIITINATVTSTVELQNYRYYHELEEFKYEPSGDGMLTINYQYTSDQDTRYYFYFETEGTNRGQINFTTYEKQYNPTSLNITDQRFCFPNCTFLFDWGEEVCILAVNRNPARNINSMNCVFYATEGRPRLWAGIGFGSLALTLVLIAAVNWVVGRTTEKKRRTAKALRLAQSNDDTEDTSSSSSAPLLGKEKPNLT